jgi:hypothetical protein
MMMIKGDRNYEAGMPPSPELMAAIGKLSEEMTKAGILLESGGLLPSSHGALVRVARGKLTITDGPFTESKELVGGYSIVEASSKAEALRLASDFMKLHTEILGPGYEGECEVRQLYDPSAFAAGKP